MLYISKRICNISLKEYAIYIPVFHMWIKKKRFYLNTELCFFPPQRFTFGLRVFFPLTNEIIYNSYNFAHRNFHYQLLHIYIPVILLYIDVKVKNSGTIVSISDFYHHLFRNCFIQVRFFFSIKGIQLYCFVLNICTP